VKDEAFDRRGQGYRFCCNFCHGRNYSTDIKFCQERCGMAAAAGASGGEAQSLLLRLQPFRDQRRRRRDRCAGEKKRRVTGDGLIGHQSRRHRRTCPVDDDDDRITVAHMPCRPLRRIAKRRLPQVGRAGTDGRVARESPRPSRRWAIATCGYCCSAVTSGCSRMTRFGASSRCPGKRAKISTLSPPSGRHYIKNAQTAPIFSPLRGFFGCIPISDLPHCFPITACSAESQSEEADAHVACVVLGSHGIVPVESPSRV
jgi:hypothetical protein